MSKNSKLKQKLEFFLNDISDIIENKKWIGIKNKN
jgi:hypothetical protein